MALRQMGIARMGPYRPKASGVNEGGKTGRPKLLHNGTGHGLTGGGGMNSKGSAGGGIKIKSEFTPMKRQLRKSKYQSNKFNAMKINEREKNRAKNAEKKTQTTGGPPMKKNPVGSFMYGHNQWGYIGPGGGINWKATGPMKGRPVISFQEALPWIQRTPAHTKLAQKYLQKREVAPAWYEDAIYARQKAAAKLARTQEETMLSHQDQQQGFDYTNSLADLQTSYQQGQASENAGLSASNIAGSGVAHAQMARLASELFDAQQMNERQRELQKNQYNANLTNIEGAFNTTDVAEQGMAKERWKATNQGKTAPKPKVSTQWMEGGVRYRANEKGIPMTAKQTKPKFKSFKSFKNAKGKVVYKNGKK